MFFTRTHSCPTKYTREELKKRLIGDHIKIHNLDFEAVEDDRAISIFPHTEQVSEIKTLPITSVEFQETDGSMKVVMTSSIRPLDQGGPILMLILCGLLIVVGTVLFFAFHENPERIAAYVVFGISVFAFALFWARMQSGYFDYVRKVRAHVVELIS